MKKTNALFLLLIMLSNLLYANAYQVIKEASTHKWQFSSGSEFGAQLENRMPVDSESLKPVFVNLSFEASPADFEIVAHEKHYTDVDSRYISASPQVRYMGNFRGIKTYSFQFYPVGIDKKGTYVILRGSVSLNKSPSNKNKNYRHDPAFKVVFDEESIEVAEETAKTMVTIPIDNRKSQGKIKIFIEQEGLYRFYGSDLEEAGIDLSSINARSLKLFNKGLETPILVSGEADGAFDVTDYIEFFGVEKKYDLADRFEEAQNSDQYFDPFTRYNVYWLDWGEGLGLRMVDESGEIRDVNPANYFKNSFFIETRHFEENNAFDALGTVDVNKLSFFRDHYFYDRGVAQGKKANYRFDLEKPLNFSGGYDIYVGIRIALTGITTVPGKFHNASLFLNNTLIFQPFSGWSNQEYVILENFSDITNSIFNDGENILELSVPDQGFTDQVTLNWFELSYLRAYTAVNNKLEFAISPESEVYPNRTIQQFEVDGFTNSDIKVYKMGLSRILNFIKESYTDVEGNTRYRIVFQDDVINKDIKYFAVAGDNRLTPDLIESEIPTFVDEPTRSLYDLDNSADYLIISHRDFQIFADEYADYRRDKNGFSSMVVLADDIYDEFNYGIKSPVAIKDFIRYAYYNWDQEHKLQYLLLIGDADSRYWDTIDNVTDFIPTFLFQTYKRGASGSDHEYALLEGIDVFEREDTFADIFVGRIPVKTNTELQNYLNKVKEYEDPANNLGDWTSKNLFISGNDSKTLENNIDGDPAFRAQNRRVIKTQVPNGLATYRLNTIKNDSLDSDPDFGGTVTLANYFNDGVNLINFLGHGGGGIWADVNLMNLNDVDRLLNKGKYPFVTSMTCFTGQYESNSAPGLMEKMVLADEKGAIAAFSSTGLGWLQNDYAILWDIIPQLMDRALTFGQTMVLNKAYYITYHRYYADDFSLPADGFGVLGMSMVHQYNLLGDPAVKMNLPDEQLSLRLENQLFADTLIFKLIIDDPDWQNSTGYYQITDSERRPVFERPLIIASQDTVDLNFTGQFDDAYGTVNVYLNNSITDGTAGIPFAVDNGIVDQIVMDPSNPEIGDHIDVAWHFSSEKEITGVKFQHDLSAPTALQKVSDNVFALATPLGPYSKRQIIVYSLTLTYSDESSEKYYGFKIEVENRSPDLAVDSRTVELSGNDKIYIDYTIINNGLADSDSFHVAIFADNSIFAYDSLSLAGREQRRRSIELPFTMNDGSIAIKVYADYFNVIGESDKSNNIVTVPIRVDRFYLTDNFGTSYDGANPDTIDLGYLKAYAGSQAIDKTTTIKIDTSFINFGEDNTLRIPFSGDQGNTLNFIFENNESKLSGNLNIQANWDKDFVANAGHSQEDVFLYVYSSRFNQWSRASSAVYDTANGSAVIAGTNFTGFAFGIVQDNIEPFVEVTVDGYSLNKETAGGTKNIYVSNSPQLSFILQDDFGINLSSTNFEIRVDGTLIEEDQLLFSGAVENAKTIGLTYYPQFNSGDHNLSVRVEDVNGNMSFKQYDFRVESDFRFEIIGVFPNPFDNNVYENCYIQFSLNQIVNQEDLSASLYTLGGRRILDFNISEQFGGEQLINIKSLRWDGRDKNGSDVANGIYFLKIRAKSSDTGTSIEKIVKIAKLR